MYLFWFFEFVFNTIFVEPFALLVDLGTLVGEVVVSLGTLISALPGWLGIPFGALIAIALFFRVSSFIPGLGGAKD